MSALADGPVFARLVEIGPVEAETHAVRLPRGRLRRPVRMELRLTPWTAAGCPRTLVELVPMQAVTPTARYFELGHRYLDKLVRRLRESGVPACPARAA